MSEQVKQENEIADLGTEKTTDDKTIGLQEEHTCTVICEDSEGMKSDSTGEEKQESNVKQQAKEKLEQEKAQAKNKNFADPVIGYLLKRCEEDQGMAEDVIQKNKTWEKCLQYIIAQARKVPREGAGVAVEDSVVYEWAEDYYHKEDNPEKSQPEKETKTKKKNKKTKTGTTQEKEESASMNTENTKEPVTATPRNISDLQNENKAAVSETTQEIEKKETKKKSGKKKTDKSSVEGQMSLFDFL